MLVAFCSFAQNKIAIEGIVTNEKHEPLIGVNVFVKGTTKGTMTDVDGKFNITATQGNTLTFKYIGYKNEEHKVSGAKMKVVMAENATNLEELVVIGYGVQKKSDLTGSLSSVNKEDIEKSGAVNISQAIQGKAAGVYVTSNSGAPGAGATIRVRGYGSISTDLTPLYVVDGQPIGESQFNSINPQDIENIEILKDASACAIYGARGANGVVLVSTKKGKEGKMSISFDASFGWSQSINRVEMMNSNQLFSFLSDAYANDGLKMPRNIKNLYYLDGKGLGPVDENGEATDINIYDTDWWNLCTQTGSKQSYNLSVSGGTDKLKSHFSFGYLKQEGVIKTSDYERFTIRVSNEYAFNKYITIGQTLGGAYIKSHDLNMPISEILLPDPFSPVYAKEANLQDPNYEYNQYMGSQYSYYGNPMGVINRQKKEHVSRNIDGTAYININLGLKGLYFKSMIGFDIPDYSYYEFTPNFDLRQNDTKYNMCTNIESKFNLKNSVQNSTSTTLSYTSQNTLNYDNSFGKHNISALAGFIWESSHYKYHTGIKYNTPSNKPNFEILDAATVDDIARGSETEYKLISYLGRINYNFDNRYLLTMSLRADGSSKFAKGHRWGVFPSFSLGWRADQESFFKDWNQDIVNGLKLRAGWGQNGNQNIPNFAYGNIVSTYETWIYGFNSAQNVLQGYASTSTGNPDIKWETSEQANVGIDVTMLNSALTIGIDGYIKTTKDMLMQNPLPSMAGYQTTPWTNAGTVRNKGIEILLGYKGKVADFTYAVNANLTFQKNKLVSTGTDDAIWGSASKNEIGEEFGRFFGYVYDGIFQNDEEIKSHVGADGKTLLQPNAKPGDARFCNVNKDNRLNADDRDYIGNPNPDIIYGGNIMLGYKGIDLAMYFQGVAGNDLWVGTKQLYRRTSLTNLIASAYTDAWRQEGDKTNVFGISKKDDNDNYRTSSWYVENGSFLKMKTLQVGCTLPSKWMKASRVFGDVRVYFSAENLFTITKFKYMDPEVPNGNALNLGIENLGYPNPRTFTIGVNVQL
ncbi:MAG: TonB-dependent receptor [Muribaculaceae bacterium]|nr:TonB-dependent receptor [Muribaculaceae bacterium]